SESRRGDGGSIFLQVAAREAYEYVFQTCVPRRQARQIRLLALETLQERRYSYVRGSDGQAVAVFLAADRDDRRQSSQGVVVHGSAGRQCEFDQVLAAELCD